MRDGLQAAERFESVHAGKPDVEKNDFEIAVCGAFQGLFRGLGRFDVIALIGKNRSERLADAGFVVNNEEVRMRRHKLECRIQGTARSGSEAKARQYHGTPPPVLL